MPTAIIIGASSGLGLAMAEQLVATGYQLGIVARREDPLLALQRQFPLQIKIAGIDVASETSVNQLENLAQQFSVVDHIIFCAAKGHTDTEDVDKEEFEQVVVNVTSFTAIIKWAYKRLQMQGYGQLVNISSVAGMRGGWVSPVYNATKAFQINYLEGLEQQAKRHGINITITDIRPGFLRSGAQHSHKKGWVVPIDKAARQCIAAMHQKKSVAYVSHRWRAVGWLQKLVPRWLYTYLMATQIK